MELVVNDQVGLTEMRVTDKAALIEHLNDRDIYDRTLRIPYPYTEADAEAWLALVARATEEQGHPVTWAIRDRQDHLVGAVGFSELQLGQSHRAEIGYWLARPHWGRGIMTAVVRTACGHAFGEWELLKIVAHVRPNNLASARVLEKNGFVQEGYLRRHFRKDGQYLDARFFALIR
jgi:RimJ/RimL family protein N-acetyltransferase